MDPYSNPGVRQPGHRSSKKSKVGRSHTNTPPPQPQPPMNMYSPYGPGPMPMPNPQLFDDTSSQDAYATQGGYPGMGMQHPPHIQGFQAQQILHDPMVASMAMNYGQVLVGQGKDLVDKKLEKYVSVSKLKYYFAVDTSYVARKLGLLFFPFTHSDWSVSYSQDEPVAPRYDLNAPDLYIPVMAFVTYVLVTGYMYGTQSRFTPEQLGMQASSALVWLVIEIFAIMLTMYITRMETHIKMLDLLAFCSYKYVGMIGALLGSLLFKSLGYFVILIYCSGSIGFFLVRTLKLQLLPEKGGSDSYGQHGSKRRLYLLLFIACLQPFMMYWLTYRVVSVPVEASLSRR